MLKNELQDPLLRAQDAYLQAENELGWLKILSSTRNPLSYIFDIKRAHHAFESAHQAFQNQCVLEGALGLEFKNRYHDLNAWAQHVLKPHMRKDKPVHDTGHDESSHNKPSVFKLPSAIKEDFVIAAFNMRCVLSSLEKSHHSSQSVQSDLAILADKERSLKTSFSALSRASERHGFSTAHEANEYNMWMNRMAIKKQQLASYIDSPA